MKINVEIDLEDTISDMFCDETNDLSGYIKGQIMGGIMREIMPKMKQSVDELVSQRINKTIEDRIEKTVDAVLKKTLEGDCLITVNREQKTVQKHIQDLFERSHGWSNPNQRIADIASKFGQELKVQYNNLFAMNIVSNLKEQGILKDDVAAMLTKPTEEK